MDTYMAGLLYTLPFTFDTFSHNDRTQSRLTAPNDLVYSSYDKVQTFHHIDRKTVSCNNSSFSPNQFINILHLKIKLPFSDHFRSVIPTLYRLSSLDRAPHLYLLSFCHLKKFSMITLNINSTSIRRVEVFQNSGCLLQYFKTAECAMLAKSPLGSQCEVSIIAVENRTNIVELINTICPTFER